MDRIVVRRNADMDQVIAWAAQLSGQAIELPFLEAEIEFREEEYSLRFKALEVPDVAFELWSPQGFRLVSWTGDIQAMDVRDIQVGTTDQRKRLSVLMLLAQDNTIGKAMAKFRALMLFSAYYREDLYRTRTVTRSKASGSHRKSGKHTRMLTTRRYEIDESMLRELPAPKREWHGYSESFGVRGHYRHYRSGKVVWVRPYEKKGRSETKSDTEYLL